MKGFWLLGALLCGLLCVSCSGPRIVEFRVLAINTEEEEVPCVVVRDEQVAVDHATNQPLVTPKQVPVTFASLPSGGEGYESVKLGVRAVVVDSSGNIVGGLEEGEASPYVEDSRFVRDGDAKIQLFILRRNKDYAP
jgi:hypothetical protein